MELGVGEILQNEHPNQGSREAQTNAKERLWTGRTITTNTVLLLLALVAGYLQYVIYPQILTDPAYQQPNVTLHLSLLTFRYDTTRCYFAGGCTSLAGIPSLDFFQLFVLITIVLDVSRFWQLRK